MLNRCAQFVLLQLLRAYKWGISPLLPPACRYLPTCSEYAIEAVEHFGAVRGGWMAFRRVLRCHPFAGSGYDPVVDQASSGKNQESVSTLEEQPFRACPEHVEGIA
jgi:uncharacterized protein